VYVIRREVNAILNFWKLFIDVLISRWDMLLLLLWQHIYISLTSMFIALIISIPLGVFLTRNKSFADSVIGFTGIFQTIPSIALFGFLLPIVGIGVKPTIIALVLYALLPIVRNVYTGIIEVNQSTVDAGRGMGMTNWQILWIIEFPLALPVIMAGVRTATISTIGVTTIAAIVGGGGLGMIIFRGVSMLRSELILAGAIPAAALALATDYLLKRLELKVTPRGMNKKVKRTFNKEEQVQ
jgi:osmoprotectant transport system permease protein